MGVTRVCQEGILISDLYICYMAPTLIMLLLVFISLIVLPVYLTAKYDGRVPALFVFLFIISALVFWIKTFDYGVDYTNTVYRSQADFNSGYSPLAHAHIVSFLTFYVLSIISLLILRLGDRPIPPLLFVVFVCFLMIGIIANLALLIQVCWNKDDGIVAYWFAFMPLIFIIMGLIVLTKVLKSAGVVAADKEYRNQKLNRLNKFMAKASSRPIWMVALMFPVYLIVMVVLVLFGQHPNAMVKVFTDTSTWLLSQKTHPPYVNYEGHYLCTVAACGHPAIVKPRAIGRRHGNPIIVNRQLQVANAFEELIQRSIPKLHRIIRKAYDDYGYQLSAKITTPWSSTLTYLLMKPLEYLFLLILYLFCIEPEKMIERQYKADK